MPFLPSSSKKRDSWQEKLCDYCEYSRLITYQTRRVRRKCILGHTLKPYVNPHSELAREICKDFKYSARKEDFGYS